MSKKKKEVWLCDNCKSDNLQAKMWVNVNTNKIIDEVEGESYWCEDCQGHHGITKTEMKITAKVEGFQLVGEKGFINQDDVHPEMDGSFCLYSMPQIDEFNIDEGRWVLLTCWTDDVEEPTIMFEGEPRGY